jgi:hypothetical protein
MCAIFSQKDVILAFFWISRQRGASPGEISGFREFLGGNAAPSLPRASSSDLGDLALC